MTHLEAFTATSLPLKTVSVSIFLRKMMSLVFVLCLLHQAVTLGNQQLCSQVTGLIKDQGCDFYNETTLSREAQLTAGIFINHFQPLFRSNCSSFSRILVCSTFAPLCPPVSPPTTMPSSLPPRQIFMPSFIYFNPHCMAFHA